jgi:hypothetical protein
MFHVVTRFGHLYYIPLIPTGSFVVLEKTADGGFRGAEIPLSGKSILAGWLRAGSVVAMIVAAVFFLVTLLDKKANPFAWTLPLVFVGLAGGLLFLTYKLRFFTHASYERARALAEHMQLNDMGLLMLEIKYGRLNAEQAQQELARREAAEAAKLPQQPVEARVIE